MHCFGAEEAYRHKSLSARMFFACLAIALTATFSLSLATAQPALAAEETSAQPLSSAQAEVSALAAEDDDLDFQMGTWYYSYLTHKYWFEYDDGTYAIGWHVIGDEDWAEIYYFDNAGWMVTGWQKIGGSWYYFHNSGALAIGWQKVGGTWYYLDPNDATMKTGWQQIDGSWYYLNGSGAMQTGWQKIGASWYYLKGSGAMATGWQRIGGAWYYLKPSGAMATGWQQIGSDWYHLQSNGVMSSNTWVGNYFVYSSGVMAKNAWVGNYYVGADGKWIPNYRPQTATPTTVYWTDGGEVYHLTQNCTSLKNAKNVISGTIAQSGKSRVCNVCGH